VPASAWRFDHRRLAIHQVSRKNVKGIRAGGHGKPKTDLDIVPNRACAANRASSLH
jgi:hypothetical protein